MMALALSEFCTASLSRVIAGEEAFAESFGMGVGVAAFCVCAPLCEQAEHTNTRIVKNSFIPFRDGSRNQNCSVFWGFSAADNRCSSHRLDAGTLGKASRGPLIFCAGADLANGATRAGEIFARPYRVVLTSDRQLTGSQKTHPFDFAQGRLCRIKRDKGERPHMSRLCKASRRGPPL